MPRQVKALIASGETINFKLILFQGYLGGELVFTDSVGVVPTGQVTRAAARS